MNNKAGWSGTCFDFLSTCKKDFITKLTSFYKQLPWTQEIPSDAQILAWEIEFDIMQETLRCIRYSGTNSANNLYIAFEHELEGESGKRAADVNLILPSGDLIVIEFKHKNKVSEQEIWRALFDLRSLQAFHSESMKLRGHCFIALTRENSIFFKNNCVICDIPK